MWLFTQHGFYSVVADRQQAGRFLVRARVRGDLENLLSVAKLTATIVETRNADYRHRLSVDAAGLATVMAALAHTVDYPNFKGRIGQLPDQRAKLDAYHKVWATVAKLQGPADNIS
jgi:hypothetical protein